MCSQEKVDTLPLQMLMSHDIIHFVLLKLWKNHAQMSQLVFKEYGVSQCISLVGSHGR